MNKKFLILIIVLLGGLILLFSFSLKKFASRRSELKISRADLENEESLLNAAEGYLAKKDYLKAKAAFKRFIAQFPASADAAKARKVIEGLNIKILFSDLPTEDSFSYEIKRGDTLVRIASEFDTTVELLKKSNNIKGDLILPGKFLKVNKAKFDILIDKAENTLELRKPGGEIVKTYRISTGENLCTPIGTFKIEEKLISPLWYKVGAIVEPGAPEYELGSRWMGLSAAGYGIHGTNDDSSIGKHITKGCVRMRNKDIEELYA
ncbi:MAG: L,D-transpeptidase family protein, partial [Candidatus Omnitrophota bacterium]